MQATLSPYMYGRIIEITIASNGTASAKKWFTLGRRQNEMPYVMPDRRTVYLMDDGTNK